LYNLEEVDIKENNITVIASTMKLIAVKVNILNEVARYIRKINQITITENPFSTFWKMLDSDLCSIFQWYSV